MRGKNKVGITITLSKDVAEAVENIVQQARATSGDNFTKSQFVEMCILIYLAGVSEQNKATKED